MQTNEAAELAAVTVAEKWLALVDAGDYAESWRQASSLFKSGVQTSSLYRSGVSEQQWQSSLAPVQAQLGKAMSRNLRSKQCAEGLPGEPDGEYVVLEYETIFEGKKNGTETIFLMKESDGEWRISGYPVVLGTSKLCAAANPAIALQLQSRRRVGGVAKLGSLGIAFN
jgi:hypothetical protein